MFLKSQPENQTSNKNQHKTNKNHNKNLVKNRRIMLDFVDMKEHVEYNDSI